MDIDLVTEPIGTGSDGEDVFLADLWPSPEEVRETVAGAIGEEMFRATYADVYTGDETWRALPVPEGELFAWEPDSTYVRRPTVLRRHAARAGHGRRHRGRTLSRLDRRLRHDRPHLARGLDQAGLAGRALPRRARRRAQGLQLVRLAPRQPRGDGARHVRERPPTQPARPRLRGNVDGARAVGRRADDLRRRRALPRRRHAARRPRRARSTARARHATGRRRARSSSAYGR